jgi:archaellum component FlaC
MKFFLKNSKVKLGTLMALIAPAFFLTTQVAHAQGLVGGFLGVTIGPFVNILAIGIPYVVAFIGGQLLQMVSYVVNYLFFINTSILPDKFGIIEIGYGISLSIANTILVIALIIIAFATILNVEEYTAKKKLGQVISTAVMINFGLLIVGVLLDLSHVITKFFLSGGEVGTTLGGALGPQRFLSLDIIGNNKMQIAFGVFEPGWFAIVGGVVMLAIFSWVLFIIMSAVGGMFIWRYIKLVGLIIVLPFAWALALLPGGSEKKTTWWHDFTEAAFFLPGAAFFIYLAIKVSETIGTVLQKDGGMLGKGGLSGGDAFAMLPQLLMQMLVVVGILLYGMKQAKQAGGEIAKNGMALGRKLSDRVVSRAEKATKKAYSGALNYKPKGFIGALTRQGGLGAIAELRGKPMSFKGAAQASGKKIADAGKSLANGEGRLGTLGRKFINPLLGGSAESGNALESIGGAIQGAGSNYEGYYKRYEEMEHSRYEAMLKHPPIENEAAMNALMKLAAKRGDMTDLVNGDKEEPRDPLNVVALAAAYKAANPDAAHHPDKDDTLKALALSEPLQSLMIVKKPSDQFLRSLDGGDVQKLNKKKFAEFADILTHGQLMTYGRKNGENEQQVMDHLTNKSVVEAQKTGRTDFTDTAQAVAEQTQIITDKKAEVKDNMDKFDHAEHNGDKPAMAKIAEKIEELSKEISAGSKERNRLLRKINLSKEERKQFPEFAFAMKELTEAAKGIGGTGSREKAADSHHTDEVKSTTVDFVYSGGDLGGGSGGGGGHGHK